MMKIVEELNLFNLNNNNKANSLAQFMTLKNLQKGVIPFESSTTCLYI